VSFLPDNPLIVQSDRTLILHTVRAVCDASGRPQKDAEGRPLTEEHPRFAEVRDALSAFAELEKSPDYLHTYRITPVSVWNAAALGLTAEEIRARLEQYSCVPVPRNVLVEVETWMRRYGLLRIEREGERFRLVALDQDALAEVLAHEQIRAQLDIAADGRVWLDEGARGSIKQSLIKLGFPVDDRGGYVEGDAFAIPLRTQTLRGAPFGLRAYQSGARSASGRS